MNVKHVVFLSSCLLLAGTSPVHAEEEIMPVEFGFVYVSDGENNQYWYEGFTRQGVYGDPKNVVDTIYGIERGREIYDPKTDAWYWLDAEEEGKAAKGKEAWIPYIFQDEIPGSTEGKWVRYDAKGAMVKGFHTVGNEGKYPIDQYGSRYYYDPETGAMAKGEIQVDDIALLFDENTGILMGDEEWKKAYADYVTALEQEKKTNTLVHLFLIDNDFIPEMAVDYPTEEGKTATILVSFRNGEVKELACYESEKDPYGDQGYGVGVQACVERKNIYIYQSRIGTRVYVHVMKLDGDAYVETDEGSYETFGSIPCCGGERYEEIQFNGKQVLDAKEFMDLLKEACDSQEFAWSETKYNEKYAPELSLASEDCETLAFGTYKSVEPMYGFVLKEDHTLLPLNSDKVYHWASYKSMDYDATEDKAIERYFLVTDMNGNIYAVENGQIELCGYSSISPVYTLAE